MNDTQFVTKRECEDCRNSKRMSLETKGELSEVKQLNTKMQDSMDKIKESQIAQSKDIEYMRVTMNKMECTINIFIKGADKRYASKLTEKIVYTMAGAGLLALLYASFELVINK